VTLRRNVFAGGDQIPMILRTTALSCRTAQRSGLVTSGDARREWRVPFVVVVWSVLSVSSVTV